MDDSLSRLERTIIARRDGDPAASYVARLRAQGRGKMAQKLGEEAVETVIAAMALGHGDGDRAALTGEAADLLFHLVVLLADCDVRLADVQAELDRREGVSGLDEKAARQAERAISRPPNSMKRPPVARLNSRCRCAGPSQRASRSPPSA